MRKAALASMLAMMAWAVIATPAKSEGSSIGTSEALQVTSFAVPLSDGKAVAVLVGGWPNVDSCTSTGVVKSFRAGASGYLAVRNAPTATAKEVARLKTGHPVWLCGDICNKRWTAIVNHHNAQGDYWECGVSGAGPATPAPYSGPCKFGWVARHYFSLSVG